MGMMMNADGTVYRSIGNGNSILGLYTQALNPLWALLWAHLSFITCEMTK
jgi:hypothetical protein